MFNNKKRLLSAFITAMMICPVANGMETKKIETIKDANKKMEISKMLDLGYEIDYESANKGNAYILNIPGIANDQLLESYEPVENGKVCSGYVATIRAYIRKSDGKKVAVKCIRNLETIKMTVNIGDKATAEEEIKFFEKIRKCEDHPGIVNCYDIVKDDNVTYIVADWLDGVPLANLPQELKDQSFEWKQRFIYKVIKKIFEITKFTEEKLNVIHSDKHAGNWIVVPKNLNENDIAKKYENFDLYLIDWDEYYDFKKKFDELIECCYKEKEKNKYFVARFAMSMSKEFNAIITLNENLNLLAKQRGRGSYWGQFSDEYQKLHQDFFIRCNKGPDGKAHEYELDPEFDEVADFHYFQSYKEIFDFCDDKIKEAEKEMEISK